VVDNVSVGGADAVFVTENDYIDSQEPPLADDLPAEYKEGDTLFGANTYLYTVAYNTDLVSEDEVPTTFDDLLDPKWKGKIAIGDVLTGAPGFINNAIRAGKIDDSWLEDFADNDPVIVPSERDAFTAVSTGQVPLGLNNYIRGEAFLQTDNLPVGFVADFEDGISDGVYFRGTVKNAPNKLASDLLVSWWLTPEAMELLAIQGQAGLMPGAPPIVGQPPLSEININPAPSLEDYTKETADGMELFTKVFG
jgi:iron(III) transport system substrate-binding protein